MDHWGGPWNSNSNSNSSRKDGDDKRRRETEQGYSKDYYSSSDPFADDTDDTCLRTSNPYYTTTSFKIKKTPSYNNNDYSKYTGEYSLGADQNSSSEGPSVSFSFEQGSPERTSSGYFPAGSYSDGSLTDSSSPGYSDRYTSSYSDPYSPGYSDSYSSGYRETCPLECSGCREQEYSTSYASRPSSICRDCGPQGFSECNDLCREQCQCEEQFKVDGCCGQCGFNKAQYRPPGRVQVTAKVLFGSVGAIANLKQKKKSSKK
ncbi:unnamed protein product [Meganyctiphanes norvegica]|uniref:Uncharacterized protein n=1 Tax=Meganyctiphanes norvegica TaxID=48144 RepID=A0AAV2S4K4_MEGNR